MTKPKNLHTIYFADGFVSICRYFQPFSIESHLQIFLIFSHILCVRAFFFLFVVFSRFSCENFANKVNKKRKINIIKLFNAVIVSVYVILKLSNKIDIECSLDKLCSCILCVLCDKQNTLNFVCQKCVFSLLLSSSRFSFCLAQRSALQSKPF